MLYNSVQTATLMNPSDLVNLNLNKENSSYERHYRPLSGVLKKTEVIIIIIFHFVHAISRQAESSVWYMEAAWRGKSQ